LYDHRQDESNSHLGLAKLKRLHIFNLDNNPDLRTLPLEMFALGSSLYVAPACDRFLGVGILQILTCDG
jgi:hypothetical protein